VLWLQDGIKVADRLSCVGQGLCHFHICFLRFGSKYPIPSMRCGDDIGEFFGAVASSWAERLLSVAKFRSHSVYRVIVQWDPLHDDLSSAIFHGRLFSTAVTSTFLACA
jgi:hypothetical protein